MQEDPGLLGPLFGFVKDTVMRMTAHGSGREFGVTLDEILAELASLGFRNIGGGVQADLRRQVARILSTPVNGTAIFEQIPRVDGTILYKVPEAYGYYEFQGYPPGAGHISREHDQPLPDTVEGLMAEVKRLKALKEEAAKRQQHLLTCWHLLANPAQLIEETKRLEGAVLSMKDMQAMVDERISHLVEFLKVSLPNP